MREKVKSFDFVKKLTFANRFAHFKYYNSLVFIINTGLHNKNVKGDKGLNNFAENILHILKKKKSLSATPT